MLKDKKTLVGIIAVVLALAGMFYYMIRDTAELEKNAANSPNLVSFDGADLKESENGVLVWSVKADSIKYNPKTKDIFLQNLTATFLKDGVEMVVKAPEGRMTDNRKKMDMTGGIKGTSSDGATFETESLHFDNVKKVLTSDKAFTYKKEGVTLTGDKLEGNTTLQVIKAIGNAKLVKEDK